MNLYETILTSILTSGIWLGVIVFLGKSLIKNLLAKDLEELKGKISAQNIEMQIVLQRVNEKRAEAISNIYLGLLNYIGESKKFVHQAEHVDEETREQMLDSMSESSIRFRDIYQKNHLYLKKETCEKIQKVLREVRIPAHQFTFALGSYLSGETLTKEQYIGEWEKAFKIFADEIPPIMQNLEDEFRFILGVE